MFTRKIRVQYTTPDGLQPCPLKWLDNFAMRNFTNASEFDDTLPVGDGILEAGTKVGLDELAQAMQNWFRRKSYLSKESELVVSQIEIPPDRKPSQTK
jgi:hypothetical protein